MRRYPLCKEIQKGPDLFGGLQVMRCDPGRFCGIGPAGTAVNQMFHHTRQKARFAAKDRPRLPAYRVCMNIDLQEPG